MDKQLLIDLALALIATVGAMLIVAPPIRKGKRK